MQDEPFNHHRNRNQNHRDGCSTGLDSRIPIKGEPGDILEVRIIDVKPRGCDHSLVKENHRILNYLAKLGEDAQSEIYSKSSVDLAMRDAFRKMRHFLMTTRGLSDHDAISLMSVAVDFGVTQIVDGNWDVHAIIKRSIFAGTETV